MVDIYPSFCIIYRLLCKLVMICDSCEIAIYDHSETKTCIYYMYLFLFFKYLAKVCLRIANQCVWQFVINSEFIYICDIRYNVVSSAC